MLPTLLLLVPAGFSRVEARFVSGVAALQARITPEKKAWFLIDTGAPESYTNVKLAEGWSGPVFKIGAYDFSFPTQPFEGLAEEVGPGGKITVSGVVGCSFLKLNQILFDATRGEVWMRAGAGLSRAEAEGALRERFPQAKASRLASIPLVWSEDDGRFRIAGRVGGRAMTWAFDTGANLLFADRKLVKAAKGIPLGGQTMRKAVGSGTAVRWLLNEVSAGTERIALPVVAEEDGDEGEDGILGMAALARSALVDLPGRMVYWLEPTSPAARTDATIGRLFGLIVRTAPDGRLLMDLDMPGLRGGIGVLSIQGEPVAALRRIVAVASTGDAKALARLTAFYRARDRATQVTISVGGKAARLTIAH